MKLWSGRFEKETNEMADAFNSSLHFDFRLYPYDIKGSIAHASMLCKVGILTEQERDDIIRGLNEILQDIKLKKLLPKDAEDVHMFIESELTRRIGEAGKKLHTARSRNDQVATDTRLFCMDTLHILGNQLYTLITLLVDLAEKHTKTVMPGFTHLQKAQPVTLAHHLLAYAEMFTRDLSRIKNCYDRTAIMPLGSAALAGTTYPIDRDMTAQVLGFSAPCRNSLDGVSDRDFIAEYLFCGALIMMHLSRFCEELILWASDEYRYITLDDAFSTGSSIMPQKKNPDMAELIRGKTGRVYGNLISILTVLKALPLAYNKDMQEDKEGLFDTFDTLNLSISVFSGMLSCLQFHTENMLASAGKGFTNATDVADYLVNKGIPFRKAHEISGKLVLYCIQHNYTLNDLPLSIYQEFSPLFSQDIFEHVDILNVVTKRTSFGGTAPDNSTKEILALRKELTAYTDFLQ